MLSRWLEKKTRIYRHTFLENLLSFIVVCIASLILLWLMLWNELNSTKPLAELIKPEYEPIIYEEKQLDEVKTEIEIKELIVYESPRVTGAALNSYDGIFYGPSGKETYYNLSMDRVIQIMRDKGYTEADYPYIVREDGVKCLGDYVMVAASLERYKKGDIIETSLGQGIVCDTGKAVTENPDSIDIAVDW